MCLTALPLDKVERMHISEGVLSAPVLASGAALAVVGTSIGLRKMDYDRIPQVAMLTAVFFLASLVHVPVGLYSVHLVMNGLLGLLLGWVAFPAILIALILQAFLFQFGGFTSLGVNTVVMAGPAVLVSFLFGALARSHSSFWAVSGAFLAGFGAVFLSSLFLGASLFLTGDAFLTVAKAAVIAHLPVMLIEGFITVVCIGFLKKVKPEVLNAVYAG